MAREPVVTYSLDFDTAAITPDEFEARLQLRLERLATRRQDRGRTVLTDRGEAERLLDWLAAQLGMPGSPAGTASFHMCDHPDGGPGTPCNAPAAELDVRAR